MNTVLRRVADLRVHSVLRGVPKLPADSQEFLVLVESIRLHGLIEPLIITSDGDIVDGRHRAAALLTIDRDADAWCMIVAQERAPEIALATLSARRHLVTKGQLAYVAFPLYRPAYEAVVRRVGEMRRNGVLQSSDQAGVDVLAEQMGVSRDEFLRAAKVHKIFSQHPELRDVWEPRILDTHAPIGLGAVIAGIAGEAATKGKARPPQRNTALSRWDCSWTELGKHARAWDRWSSEDRDHAAEKVRTTVADLPDPLLDVLRDALRAARRARNAPES